jgi:subtilisin family serine protease
MNSRRARDLMQNGRPREQFAINQRYMLYHPARKNRARTSKHSIPARRGAERCSGNRCFAKQVIRWHSGIGSCAKNLRVGVIDTNVDSQHPAFAKANMQLGVFLPQGAKSADAWHGTGVVALLAGAPDSGTPGLIPEANFFIASVFTKDKRGDMATDTVSLLSALEWMSAFDVKVINMSFSGPKDELVEQAIERMNRQGVQFVAAVGNDGPSATPSYPASYRPVIAVTAINKDLRNYPYANRGNRVDLAAPGVDIWTAVPGGREGYHTGTSFAAPYVTAMLATIYNQTPVRQKQNLLDQFTVIDLGPRGRDPIYGRGLMVTPASCSDFGRAVAQDGGGSAPAPASPQSPSPAIIRTTPSSGPSANSSSASFR